MAQGKLPWQPILRSKLAKSDYSPLFGDIAIRFGMPGQQKTDDPGLLYGVVCVILFSRFGTVQVCDRRMNERTHNDSIIPQLLA